jgi:peptidyl-prolyl cis-trans isomerase D
LQETEAGTYFVIKLDRIEEARVPSLEEGRANVRAAWQIAERNKAALTAAEALAAAIKGGATLSEAAKAKGYELIEANDLMRRQQTTVRGLTGEIQHRLFEERPDAPGPIVGAFPDGYVVAMLKAVATPDNATEKAAVENLAKEIGRSRASEIYQTFQFALQEHFPFSFYAKVFNSTFPSTE